MQVWGAQDAVQRLPVTHLAYVTAVMCACLKQLTKVDVERIPGLMPAVLSGITTHLDNAVPAIRSDIQSADRLKAPPGMAWSC